jgi:hypothetical protein
MFLGFRDTGTTVLHTNRRPVAPPYVRDIASLRPLQRGGGFVDTNRKLDSNAMCFALQVR